MENENLATEMLKEMSLEMNCNTSKISKLVKQVKKKIIKII